MVELFFKCDAIMELYCIALNQFFLFNLWYDMQKLILEGLESLYLMFEDKKTVKLIV